ncbi:MAG: TonB-dependent receptor [Phenylobacterium sp.]
MRRFRIPAAPLDQALVRFALQAGVSIGGSPSSACGLRSRRVEGLYTPQEALGKLLPEGGCTFEAIDGAAFRIVPPRPHAEAPRHPVTGPAASPRPPARTVGELVVTAEKRPDLFSRTAYAVSALSGDEVRRLGARSFDEVAFQMTGVTVTNLGSGRNKIFIRGLSDGSFTGKTQSTVGLYLDDVPITYNAPDPDLRLVDVERVEVLRGPQGTLYGSGSIGGIVRVVTAKPDPDGYAGMAGVDGAVTQHGSPSSSFQAMVNVPLLRDRAALRLVAYRGERGGYIDNLGLYLKDVNHSRRSGYRASLLVDLDEGWEAQTGYTHQSIHTADAQYAQDFVRQPLSRINLVQEPHANDFDEFYATVSHAGRIADLKVSAAYVDHEVQTRYDATGAFAVPGGARRRVAFDEGESAKLAVVEATLTSTGQGAARWLMGAFASHDAEADTAELRAPQETGRIFSVSERKDRVTELAVYGEGSLALTRRLTLTGGLRWFQTRLVTTSEVFNPDTGPAGLFTGRITDRGMAPKVRVSFEVRPDMLIYAQAQEGFRAGGFNNPEVRSLGRPDPAVLRSVPRFAPDRLVSYEIGASLPLFDRVLSLRGALFHADWSDLQTDQYLASGLPMTVNIGDGANTGVELEAVWRPDDRLQVRGNLTVDNPQLTRIRDVFPARRDSGLPGVPSIMGSMDVRYAWPVGSTLKAQVSGQMSYVGHSFLTFDAGPATDMGGYGVGRMAAEISGRHWRIEGYLDNVADETGNTFAFGNPFSRARALQSTPLRPRTAGLGLSWSF